MLIFIIKSLVLFTVQYIKIRISASYMKNTMHQVFAKTIEADWPYLLNQKVGHLENVIMIDIAKSGALLRRISMLIITVTSLLMYIVVAMNISVFVQAVDNWTTTALTRSCP